MQGTYKYYLNDEPTGIVETFSIEKFSNGSIKTISERDASQFGTKILVEHEKFLNGSVFFKIHMENKNSSEVANVSVNYSIDENTLKFNRKINDKKTEKQTSELPENCLVFPLMRCFQGETILRVSETKSVSNVLVPSIENPEDPDNLLKPTFDERTAEKISNEKVNGINTGVYKYLSKHYAEDSKFWINENGLLIKYVFHQTKDKIWKVELINEQ